MTGWLDAISVESKDATLGPNQLYIAFESLQTYKPRQEDTHEARPGLCPRDAIQEVFLLLGTSAFFYLPVCNSWHSIVLAGPAWDFVLDYGSHTSTPRAGLISRGLYFGMT
jgi:hypothetical protein